MSAQSPSFAASPTPLAKMALPGARLRSDQFYRRWFFGVCLAHAVVWTLIPTLTQPNAPIDVIEMLYWGEEWELGYHKHPPLTAWLAEGAANLSGDSLWSVYLASQVAMILCFWAVWRLGLALSDARTALLSVLLLQGVYYYSYTSTEFNNNVALMPFWALGIVAYYRALADNRLLDWFATGAALGLALLAKYSAAFLILPMLLFLAHPAARSRVGRGPLLAAAVAAVLFLPHLAWVVRHDFITIRYAMGRAEAEPGLEEYLFNPLEFVASQAVALLPLVICAGAVVGWRWRLRRVAPAERFGRDFLLAMVLGPFVLHLILALLLGFNLRSMWGAPLWTFSGLALVHCLEQRTERLAWPRAWFLCGLSAAIMVTVTVTQNVAGPYLAGKPRRIHFPGEQLAHEVGAVWERRFNEPLRIVAGDWWLAGNVCFYTPTPDQVYASQEPGMFELPSENSPWTSDQALLEQGGIILWDVDRLGEELDEVLLRRFPTAEVQPAITLHWQTGAPVEPIRVGIAVVPPAARTAALVD